MRITIAGGVQKVDAMQKEGLHRYARGRVLELDPDRRERTIFDYVSPPEHGPSEDPSIVFTAATVARDRIYVPTKTEVLIFDRQAARIEAVISAPAFNDLHHVVPGSPGRFWVVNTGLDQVLEVDRQGGLCSAYSVVDADPWARFDEARDYRKVSSTKPHAAHPNYLLRYGDRWWVTRFKQRDCIALGTRGERAPDRMPIDLQGCHDGFVLGDDVYFTTVDGHLVRTRPGAAAPLEVWDLNAMVPGLRKLGWCRGLFMLGADEALVGFSRLRITKWRENVAWAGGMSTVKALGHRPTRVTRFDLRRGRVVWSHDLAGLDAVFSIHVER